MSVHMCYDKVNKYILIGNWSLLVEENMEINIIVFHLAGNNRFFLKLQEQNLFVGLIPWPNGITIKRAQYKGQYTP